MWPHRIENPIFLQSIYGHYPSLTGVEVTSALLNRDGPSLLLSFISKALPYKPPRKWEKFNRVLFCLRFFDVRSVSIRKFGSDGLSDMRMWDDLDRILLVCDGTVQLSLQCPFLFVDKISGLLVEESN